MLNAQYAAYRKPTASMEKPKKRKAWRIWRRIISICATFALFICVVPFVLLAVVASQDDGETINIPSLNSLIERKVSENAADFKINVKSGGLSKGDSFFNPKIVFHDVVVRQKTGAPIVSLPNVSADSSLVSGIVSPDGNAALRIDKPTLFLNRDTQGRFNFTAEDQENAFTGTFDQLIDGFFDLPIAKNLKAFEMTDVALSYVDSIHKSRFHLNNGQVKINAVDQELMISSAFELPRDNKVPSLILFSGRRTRGSDTSDITFKIDNANPISLADQVPALDWLRNIEAEVNASFVVELDENARPIQMNGVLDLGDGQLRETPSNSAATFNKAKAYFEFDAAKDKLAFTNFTVETTLGNVIGAGSAQMQRDLSGEVIGADLALQIDQLLLSQTDMFDDALAFENGRANAHVTFDPLQINISKAILNHGDLTVVTQGDLWAREKYWQSKFDIRFDQISADQIKLFWPKTSIPKTRGWVSRNLQAGLVSDLTGFFSRQDGETQFDFKFAFDDVTTGLVATLPPMFDGQGEGNLTQEQLTLNLAQGYLTPDNGTPMDLRGSLFHIADITQRPAIGQITLSAQGDLESGLKALDAPKFRYIQKFGQSTDVARGNASVLGWLEVPLIKGAKQEEIKFDISGNVTSVASDTLIKGRKLRAKTIAVHARDTGIKLSGNAVLDGIPAKFNWSQAFVNNPKKQGDLISSITLNQASLDAFNISLPKGSFSGATPAQFKLKMLPKQPATFTLTSDLRGAVLNVGSLGWRKGKNEKGKLAVAGRLSTPIQVNDISIATSGLTAKGNIALNKDGSFQKASFPTLKIDRWLSTAVTLAGSGSNATTTLSGGSMDLRRLNTGDAGGGKAGPLNINLDRLRLTDDLSLTNFRASVIRNGIPSGTFRAQVNNGARINGEILRGKRGGSRIVVTGQDAGAILKSAGFFDNIKGGNMRLVLEPNGEKDVYVGNFEATNFRMKHSNSMAKLLDGISVVGLIQNLEEGGIQFDKAKGRFELRPEGVKLQEVSLVGVSMGISLKGWYASNTKTVDFDGVVTPLYAVNGLLERIGGKLFGRQKGEGVFSFVYTMKGPAAGPKVKVKPLSILTPGVFRQIFRQDIPAPPK
jgi:hypothetical protein